MPSSFAKKAKKGIFLSRRQFFLFPKCFQSGSFFLAWSERSKGVHVPFLLFFEQD
jgi:hypothetical protein